MDEVVLMEQMRYMKDTDGWKLVEKHIRNRIMDNKNRLMICPIEDIEKHRERVKTLESVLLFVDEVIEQGTEALREQPP